INRLKESVKQLEEREGVAATNSGDDAPIKGRSMDEGDATTERVSEETEEMATVLTSMDAATVLAKKSEHNIDFHPMVDFVAASPLRYALTVKPTVYVSHLRQFWSTARIETKKEGTKILAIVDGIVRTVSESSLRQNLKLQDEEGISSLPDAKLFENLTLMGYNISPNQKFTFQKGQLSHQWKYLIHTIMQCLSPKSIGFNEFSSNIATALVCLATSRTYNFCKMIFDGLVKNVNNKVLKFLMYPRFLTMCLRMSQFGQITHTQTYVVPFHTKKLFTTLRMNSPSFSGRTVPLFAAILVHQGEGSGTPAEPHQTPSPEAQTLSHTTHPSSSHPPITTTSIPTVTSIETTPIRQYTRRTRIAQSSVPPTIEDEPASPQRDVSQGEACPTDSGFIADQDRATIAKSSTLSHDSAPWATSFAVGEDKLLAKFQTQEVEINRLKERVKTLEDKEGVIVDRSGDDAPIKGRRIDEHEVTTERLSSDTEEVPTGSGSIPTAGPPAAEVPTGSDVVATASSVFATANVVTPVTRRKGKEKEDQRRAEQISRDAEIARIHAEEELQSMINGLDSNNETIAKYLEEYRQFSLELPLERRIELISDLVKDFRGMTFEEVEAKFNSVCKQMEDFIPMGSKKEAERIKRKEVPEEKAKEMMNLVPIEEVYVEALQVKHPIIDWKVHLEGQRNYWKITRLEVKETLSTRPPTSNKEMELWVELSRLYEPNEEDQLQRQRNLYACGEGLPSEEGSSTCDDLLQTSSGELLTDGK
nr:hypothetical protein [Tanacetum cinerariifolium]